MIFDRYPYTNFHEMNDDWIIRTLREFDKRLDEFVAANSLTYADPIEYNPETTYPANTVLIYDGTAYVTKAAAPAGVLPTNSDYYIAIFPFGALIQSMVDAGVDAGVDEISERVDTYVQTELGNVPVLVNQWMDEHPEITTPIPDGAVSFPKLDNALREVLLINYHDVSVESLIPNTDFEQGGIDYSTGEDLASTNACRTDYFTFPEGVVVLRAVVDEIIMVFKYTAEGQYVGRILPYVDMQWNAFVSEAGHKYRFTAAREDLSDITPGDLSAAPIYYRVYTNSSEADITLSDIDEHETNFVVPVSDEYIAASLADFDRDYRTYESVQVTNTGTVISSQAFDTYAFKCPYDGFVFRTSIYRIFITSQYPQVGVSLPIETILADNVSDMTADRVIPKKGDIVVLCTPKSSINYFTSPYANAAKIGNLVLSDQFDTFKRNAVVDPGVSIVGNDLLGVQKIAGKLITSTTGGLSNNTTYDTYYFRVPVPVLTVKCSNGFRACLSLTDPTGTVQAANLKQLLYNTSSQRIETFTAHLNDWVVISIPAAQSPIDLQTDYANRFTLPELRLDWRQATSFYKYVTETNARRLYVYYKSGDKYVRWELHNIPTVASNSNTWQLGAVYGYDETLTTGVELVGAGEFELAFKEWGAADFCGGNNHGDENTDDFTLMIDGEMITLENLDDEYHVFDRIDVIEHATINRCDTPDEDILKHQKAWTFEHGTVKVRQSLEFLEALQCDFLCCMLAANRSAFQYGIRQGRVGIEDMSTSTFPKVSTSDNEMFYLMYGPHADAKVSAVCESHSPAASLWVNNASTINKLYYNFYGQIPNTQVAQGTVLRWRSEYDIAYH